MKNVFVATSYSSKVNYSTGEVFPEYREWLEGQLNTVESMGYKVFCAIRADGYRIANDNPAEAFFLDVTEIKKADIFLALLSDQVSAGVQVEVGYALALEKRVILAHAKKDKLAWFNQAIVEAKQAKEISLPVTVDQL